MEDQRQLKTPTTGGSRLDRLEDRFNQLEKNLDDHQVANQRDMDEMRAMFQSLMGRKSRSSSRRIDMGFPRPDNGYLVQTLQEWLTLIRHYFPNARARNQVNELANPEEKCQARHSHQARAHLYQV